MGTVRRKSGDGNGRIERLIRQGLRAASFSFDLRGAVLFGSQAAGDASDESDIDLLVIACGIPLQRQRRSKEILAIKRLFPGLPLDILLMTPEEAQNNFRNHNPLFFDIAEDGVILFDPEGALQAAMQETRRYIRERGIERLGDGWRFPATRGAPTYLSRISNKEFARGMLQDAGRDHRIGQRLLEDGFFDKAVYHFGQAVEKSIKAILICFGEFRRTHLVGAVLRARCGRADMPGEWEEPLLRLADHSNEMEPDLNLSRYPGIVNDALWLPFEEYSVDDARAAEVRAAEAVEIAERFTNAWFSDPTALAT